MSELDRAALSWLRTHHATIPTSELARDQRPIDQRKRLVRAGVLERVVDGAYAFSGVEPDELARCSALCTSRPHLVVAGPTAGRLWDLRRSPRDGVVHVLAPPRSHPCREPWVRAYRTELIFDDEVVRRPDGIRVTSPPRTVVDLTRYVDASALESVIEHALDRQLCTVGTLRRTAERLATPGRPWARRFLAVLALREPGAPAESDWEHRVFDGLTARGVRGLERQVEVELPGYGRARFDIAIAELAWALEVDVHPRHRTREGAARDSARDDAAEAVGWLVRRVTEMQLEHDFAATLDDAVAAIARRRTAVAALRAAGAWPHGRGER